MVYHQASKKDCISKRKVVMLCILKLGPVRLYLVLKCLHFALEDKLMTNWLHCGILFTFCVNYFNAFVAQTIFHFALVITLQWLLVLWSSRCFQVFIIKCQYKTNQPDKCAWEILVMSQLIISRVCSVALKANPTSDTFKFSQKESSGLWDTLPNSNKRSI